MNSYPPSSPPRPLLLGAITRQRRKTSSSALAPPPLLLLSTKMRARNWSRLAIAATTTYYVQCTLLLLVLPTAPTAAGTPPSLPTQDSSAYISRGDLPIEDSSSSSSDGDSASGRLAVVVPAWRGDVDRALAAVARWPPVCSAVTLSRVELVLYMAEGEEESSAAVLLPALERTAGRCFAQTKVVYAHLREQVREGGRGERCVDW